MLMVCLDHVSEVQVCSGFPVDNVKVGWNNPVLIFGPALFMNDSSTNGSNRNAWEGYSIGISMMSSMAVCLLAGWYVDKKFPGIAPTGIICGGVMGVVSMVYVGLKESNRS